MTAPSAMLAPADIEWVSALVRARAGVVLRFDKAHVIASRLAPVARREGFASVPGLIAAVRARRDERLADFILDAMMSKETWFFRDRAPFASFGERVLPALIAARRPGETVRIWSAGCATGQEAYSLAMLIDEAAPQLAGRAVEIVATDIAQCALEKAKAGVYSQFEVQRGLPIRRLLTAFEQHGKGWRLRPAVQRFVSFRRVNLLKPLDALGTFDAVFCRNVLSGLDPEIRLDVLGRIADRMNEGGWLALGAAEGLDGAGARFDPAEDAPCFFEKRPARARAA